MLHHMKRFLLITILSLLFLPLSAQEARIYYEGLVMYPVEKFAYEFQSLVDHYENPRISHITDSTFLAFLIEKIESVEKCTEDGECLDATYKPSCMIQVVFIKDKYSYYTINLSSGWGNAMSLTIDGKSYIPDEELQDVVLEIVKYRVVYNRPISTEKLHAILQGEKMKKEEAPNWPFL